MLAAAQEAVDCAKSLRPYARLTFNGHAYVPTAEIERLTAENERLLAALGSCQSWIERWTKHVGNCNGGAECTCGRSAVLFDASDALDQQNALHSEEGK